MKSHSYRKRPPTPRPEIDQPQPVRVIAKPDATKVSDTVLTPLDDEAVQVLIGPVQDQLQRRVEICDADVAVGRVCDAEQGG